ncbi:MAG: glycosyltransferase family 4 protein [Desulfobacula sp.]|uniref:glycosyltransferase family 4 protein n=1 Tax=Desulfobacula sp. TaxID=2593537 RepID=UPI0025BB9987|nr:glycosyltransferase family 4 protein [Desulfobacula sp.]MCD4720408.1 glycosyltransferase family 4 protein [Desulfobacula sp.]
MKKKIAIFIGSNLSEYLSRNKSINIVTVLSNWKNLLGDIFTMDIVSEHRMPQFLCKGYNTPDLKTINAPAPKLIKDLFLCIFYIKNYKPDLMIHISNPNRDGMIISFAGKIFNIPTIVRFTGDTYNRHKNYTNIIKKLPALASLISAHLAYKYSSQTVCLGPIMKKMVEQKADIQARILPMPVNFDKFFPVDNKAEFKKDINAPIEKNLVLFVGRLDLLKGSDLLFDIITTINTKRDDYFFGIIGEGPDHKKLSGINKNVALWGNVPYNNIHIYYKAADILLLPSKTEGMPNVILESLACGTPVLATDVGEIPSVVSNICCTSQDFINFLVKRNWKLDKLPDYYKPQQLKHQYLTIFNETMK